MAKLKTLEQLRAEKKQVETQLTQEQRKLERLENRNPPYDFSTYGGSTVL